MFNSRLEMVQFSATEIEIGYLTIYTTFQEITKENMKDLTE